MRRIILTVSHSRGGMFLVVAGMGFLAVLCAGCPGGTKLTSQFAADVRLGEAPFEVHFTDTSVEGKVTIDSWAWDFGDGSTSTEENPVHTYTTPGAYSVSLTVGDTQRSTHYIVKPNYVFSLSTDREEGAAAGEARTFAGIDFVWIPAGTFDMGNSSESIIEPDALPVHAVTISRGFWMSKYEITQTQWFALTGHNLSHFRITQTDYELPVENVSWDDAQGFIQLLNAAQNDGGIYRLPTEAEWEYACRAGTTTDYNYGDDPDASWAYGWTWLNARYSTMPPGMLQPNAWGLYDMHGNVWEWCLDRYSETYYTESPSTDPMGPDVGPYRVARGGSWYHTPHAAFSGARFGFLAGTRYNFIGFRIVRQ